MMSMGFSEKKCKKALLNCDNNLERATDWVFSHMDDDVSDTEMQGDIQSGEPKYKCSSGSKGIYSLQSFITHLGSSVHAGHYVCHINNDGNWVYFNDDKVAVTDEPPFGKGYMYFL